MTGDGSSDNHAQCSHPPRVTTTSLADGTETRCALNSATPGKRRIARAPGLWPRKGFITRWHRPGGTTPGGGLTCAPRESIYWHVPRFGRGQRHRRTHTATKPFDADHHDSGIDRFVPVARRFGIGCLLQTSLRWRRRGDCLGHRFPVRSHRAWRSAPRRAPFRNPNGRRRVQLRCEGPAPARTVDRSGAAVHHDRRALAVTTGSPLAVGVVENSLLSPAVECVGGIGPNNWNAGSLPGFRSTQLACCLEPQQDREHLRSQRVTDSLQQRAATLDLTVAINPGTPRSQQLRCPTEP